MKKIKVPALFLVSALLLTSLVCKGCVNPPPQPLLQCESVTYSDSVEKPNKVYAYIDASGSMKGYFSLESDGRFITAISDVNPDRICWMDTKFTTLEGVPTNALLTNRFSGGQSRFDLMLSGIIERDSLIKFGGISLLFTDGILSASVNETDSNPNYMKMSFGIFKNYISKELKKVPGIAVAIFKLESKYSGNYWNYQNKSVSVDIQDRPFYVIAIGRPAQVRYFSKNNKLEASLYEVFGVYDKKVKKEIQKDKSGAYFAPVVPKDFKGNKLLSNMVAFTLTLPDYVAQYDSAYIKNNLIITLDGVDQSQMLRPLINVAGKQLTIENWNTNNPAYPILTSGMHTLKVQLPHRISSDWKKLYSEDDLNINKNIDQQKRTFALEYLIKGIQEGMEEQNIIFSSSVTFVK